MIRLRSDKKYKIDPLPPQTCSHQPERFRLGGGGNRCKEIITARSNNIIWNLQTISAQSHINWNLQNIFAHSQTIYARSYIYWNLQNISAQSHIFYWNLQTFSHIDLNLQRKQTGSMDLPVSCTQTF